MIDSGSFAVTRDDVGTYDAERQTKTNRLMNGFKTSVRSRP
ncbi:hypothetical protein OG948_56890 (plasmid) [Embleya sp. NBC_00888]|nr:hypothetical protein OG948_56890 [Embleya sp. NBC_00888]